MITCNLRRNVAIRATATLLLTVYIEGFIFVTEEEDVVEVGEGEAVVPTPTVLLRMTAA